jgi:hypothetical protein
MLENQENKTKTTKVKNEYGVVTTIQIINEESSVFPVVTICNSNPYVTKYAENLTKDLAKEYLAIEL